MAATPPPKRDTTRAADDARHLSRNSSAKRDTAPGDDAARHLSVARMAARQHGVVTTRQMLDIGFTPATIRHRARTGRLHRMHQGVYAVGHIALPSLARESAAVLACGPDAVLSHRSAAAIWGLL